MADSFEEAAAKQREAQGLLDGVKAQKRKTALRNPQTDTSTETAEQAKRTWNRGN